MSAAIGALIAVLVIASSIAVAVALTRARRLREPDLTRAGDAMAKLGSAFGRVGDAAVIAAGEFEKLNVKLNEQDPPPPAASVSSASWTRPQKVGSRAPQASVSSTWQRPAKLGGMTAPEVAALGGSIEEAFDVSPGDVLGLEGDARLRSFEAALGDARERQCLLHRGMLIAIALLPLTACGPDIVIDLGDLGVDGDPTETSTGDPVETDAPGLPDVPEECPPGSLDCECATGNGCDAGLECAAGVCVEAEPFEMFTECDDDGRCWVRRAWWSAWVQLSDPDGIQAGLDEGTLVQVENIDGAKCYEYGEPPGTVCALGLDGVTLHARPLDEIDIVSEADCAGDGPWSSSFASTFWCYGRFGSLGVALRGI